MQGVHPEQLHSRVMWSDWAYEQPQLVFEVWNTSAACSFYAFSMLMGHDLRKHTSLSDVDGSVVLRSFSIVEAAAKILPSELLRT